VVVVVVVLIFTKPSQINQPITILRGNVGKHYIHHKKITMSNDKITLKM